MLISSLSGERMSGGMHYGGMSCLFASSAYSGLCNYVNSPLNRYILSLLQAVLLYYKQSYYITNSLTIIITSSLTILQAVLLYYKQSYYITSSLSVS